jgi:hypothetical protein
VVVELARLARLSSLARLARRARQDSQNTPQNYSDPLRSTPIYSHTHQIDSDRLPHTPDLLFSNFPFKQLRCKFFQISPAPYFVLRSCSRVLCAEPLVYEHLIINYYSISPLHNEDKGASNVKISFLQLRVLFREDVRQCGLLGCREGRGEHSLCVYHSVMTVYYSLSTCITVASQCYYRVTVMVLQSNGYHVTECGLLSLREGRGEHSLCEDGEGGDDSDNNVDSNSERRWVWW